VTAKPERVVGPLRRIEDEAKAAKSLAIIAHNRLHLARHGLRAGDGPLGALGKDELLRLLRVVQQSLLKLEAW
jgi:hypothetical protein